MKILAIDDNNDNLIILRALIKDAFPDSKLYTANNGLQGIELANDNDPDVILLDILMPDMDGFEVCRRIKLDRRLSDIPVIFLTALKDCKVNRNKALRVGADAFISKPIDEAEFTAQIRAMVKIKSVNKQNRDEKEHLAKLVYERTKELEQNQYEMVKLLEDLKAENKARKKTEAALLESEIHFRTLADSGLALIWTTGVDRRCDYFNQPWLNFTGRELSQELGFGWLDGVHPDDVKKCTEIYMDAFDHRVKFSMEYRIRHVSGDYRWIQDVGSPRYDSKGCFIGYIGHCLDVNERKQAEEALLKSERQKATLISNLPGFAYRCLYDSNWTMKYISMGCQIITGYLPEDFLNNGKLAFNNIILSDYHEYISGKWIKALRCKNACELEYPILTKGGDLRWVWERGRGVFSEIGDLLYLEGFITDITERKQAENKLKESESRLQELNATKDKFFSIIAHDLKSPFNSIMGFSNLLVESIQKKDYTGMEDYAGIIQSSSQRVMGLLMNLLEWSRTQTGRMEFNPEYIEVGTLTSEAIALSYDSAQQKAITITNHFPYKVIAFADKTMISIILRNLISNAIKFTNQNGEISITVEDNQDEWVISVIDNGVGISKDNIGKVFRIDEGYSTRGTQNEQGSGLGLLLCKEFIQKHKGRIWVESEFGVGSKFCFTIPKVLTESDRNSLIKNDCLTMGKTIL